MNSTRKPNLPLFFGGFILLAIYMFAGLFFVLDNFSLLTFFGYFFGLVIIAIVLVTSSMFPMFKPNTPSHSTISNQATSEVQTPLKTKSKDKVSTNRVQALVCKQCKAEVTTEDVFCSSCGLNLT